MQKQPFSRRSSIRVPALTILFFTLFLFLVETLWPDGSAFLRENGIFPGKSIAVSALNEFADELSGGVSPISAALDFCRQLLG